MPLEPLPELHAFCRSGLDAGRALGKPARIEDSDADLVWEAACELRDFVNYIEGRLNQKPGPLEAMHLRVALAMVRNAYRVLGQAREYQRRGGV